MKLIIKTFLFVVVLVLLYYIQHTRNTVYLDVVNNSNSLSSKESQDSAGMRADEGSKSGEDIELQAVLEEQAKNRRETTREDLEVIHDLKSDLPQLSFSLLRLATQRNTLARDRALALIKSEDKKISMIAFRVLGYFDESSVNSELRKQSRSNDHFERSNAILALTWNPQVGSERKELLEDLLKSSNSLKSSVENIQVLNALYRMSDKEEEKLEYFNQVLNVAKSANTVDEQQRAIRSLLQMNSQNVEVKALMKKFSKN